MKTIHYTEHKVALITTEKTLRRT